MLIFMCFYVQRQLLPCNREQLLIRIAKTLHFFHYFSPQKVACEY